MEFKVTPSPGKVMLVVFLDSRAGGGVLTARFQKLGENVNSATYCDFVLKLRDAIRRKLPGQLVRGALLHHDNAKPHTALATRERIQELQWELLEHPHHSPDWAPSDFLLFDPLKKRLGGRRFADDEEVETEVWKWLRQQSKDFYAAGFDALEKQWDTCISVGGGYVQARVSHVLRFISFCEPID
jgi:histone-lysine N-methyltransferase SETMAR